MLNIIETWNGTYYLTHVPKTLSILTTEYTCHNMWEKKSVQLPVDVSKNNWTSGKRGVWSRSTQFAKSCLYQY